MALPSTPEGWAIQLSKLLALTMGDTPFPVNVRELAIEYSRNAFPAEAITLIQGADLSNAIEGMLHPKGNGEWGIFYNTNISSSGRQNFTLAHEFGHYLLHRHLQPQGFECGNRELHDRGLQNIESEANRFASVLLMPPKDFREQIAGTTPNLELMRHLAKRYEVSITAAMLQWLEFTDQRAMVVAGIDGFIDWARSSPALFKSGLYYRARQEITELPLNCLANQKVSLLELVLEKKHPSGVWLGREPVEEFVLFQKGNRTISLLIYPKHGISYFTDDEEPLEDIYDRISKNIGGRR